MHQITNRSIYRLALSSCAMLTVLWAGTGIAQTTQLRSGLLADVDQSVIYAMNPAGGMQAINVENGEVLWRNNTAERPIILSEGRLLAQGSLSVNDNELNLLSLDATSGAAISSGSITLPEEVKVSVDEGLGTRFEVSRVNDSVLAWQSESRLVQGLVQENPLSANLSSGALQVDLLTSNAESIDSSRIPTAQPTVINALPQERISSASGRQFSSADRNHILSSERLAADRLNVYQWSIYNQAGDFLGDLAAPVSRGDFLVLNDDAIMVYVAEPFEALENGAMVSHPLSLVAIELASGNTLWSRPLRDTRYRGPFPP